MGFIQPISSSHSILILFIKKKNGSLYLYVDFYSLNCISKKDHYPLPLISDLLDSPYKAQVYKKIDLCHAYHLVHIVDSDEQKIAFKIYYRSFKWFVMLFGLTNTPMAFQQFINNLFSNLLDACVMIYLGDILIHSNNIYKHHWHVKKVLKCLCKANLYAKAEKCEFYSKLVKYLEYIFSSFGLIMFDNKVKIIQDQLGPKKVKNIQSFLDFAKFYCQFIFNYSGIIISLTHLIQKDIPWKFDSFYCDTFNFFKKAFTSAPILIY